ncbi:MAG: hypothetical protein LBS19_03355 [Clostridiales bacterium]|jgi:D-alanyl-D-alanine carboxypeptidase (penicillin-binding protein 5/6)|nr:hypothetical protein [Clostridiales bacterium]
MKRISAFITALIIILINPLQAPASEPDAPAVPAIAAKAAVLMESGSGKVIYGKNESERIFPAGMVKILTALVALDYLDPDELIVTGAEIDAVPYDSSKVGHVRGESITVLNLLRALLITSGNESSCVLALAASRIASENPSMGYSAAERHFSGLMNQKARSAGAVNSNFTNPHGYHHQNMYSTAYDIAMICREALKNDVIREILAETDFSGNGAGGLADGSMTTKNYNWKSGNELIIPGSAHYYQYATGLKTGRHSAAGDCLAASASKDGVELIAILCDDPDRWANATALFNHGFDNYAYQTSHKAWSVLGEAPVLNPRLQEADTLEYYITQPVEAYMNRDEAARVITDVILDPELVDYEGEQAIFRTPVSEGQIVGEVTVSLDRNVMYSGYVTAARDALERTISTDFEYYKSKIQSIFFTAQAVPYWIIAFLLIIIFAYIFFRLAKKRRASTMFSAKRKYFK